jgi:poly-gamma-glutamate capsule biosynthesis protein CapA/YwtB (metallophosphatase superfamily)
VVVNDIRITFISFNQFLGGNEANTISRIQNVASTSDVVIVLAHWGEEYQEQPPPYVSKWAHAFVDAGADAVFGSHPHVIGDIEEYRGATIYYSLGNFVFDQYWESRVRCGLGVGLFLEKTATGTSVTYDAVRFGMERSRQTVLGCR